MRQFDSSYVLPMHTAFVKSSDVYVISPLMCYNSCRDAMNSYFTTGQHQTQPCSMFVYRCKNVSKQFFFFF